jgi:uncharacterized protein (TIGR02147 family)
MTQSKNDSTDVQVLDKIYDYDNYRMLIKDYFEEQRELRSFFSHRYFAQKAGFGSHSFCAYIMDGKRNLSHTSIPKMVKGLGLKGKKAEYFQTLVYYNQSRNEKDRESYYKVLQRLRKSTSFYKVNRRQFAYFDHWYYPVIRELAVHSDWEGDYEVLANLVRPSITVLEAKKAIKTLVEIGLLELCRGGEYKQPNAVITAKNVPGFVFKNSRRDFIKKAIEASEHYTKQERHITSTTLTMSHAAYQEATKLIDEVRKKILILSTEDEDIDGVYTLNCQLFPLSQSISQRNPDDTPRSKTDPFDKSEPNL